MVYSSIKKDDLRMFLKRLLDHLILHTTSSGGLYCLHDRTGKMESKPESRVIIIHNVVVL